jgi:hypothetical protein
MAEVAAVITLILGLFVGPIVGKWLTALLM